MNALPSLPSNYRSWTSFYLALERELKEQGATYAPHGMDGAALLKWLEDPDRVCEVPDNLEVEFRYQENLFLDVYEEKKVCINMRDVKLKIFEEAMEVLREREVLIQLRRVVHTHVPPMHPMYNEFETLIARILEIT